MIEMGQFRNMEVFAADLYQHTRFKDFRQGQERYICSARIRLTLVYANWKPDRKILPSDCPPGEA